MIGDEPFGDADPRGTFSLFVKDAAGNTTVRDYSWRGAVLYAFDELRHRNDVSHVWVREYFHDGEPITIADSRIKRKPITPEEDQRGAEE